MTFIVHHAFFALWDHGVIIRILNFFEVASFHTSQGIRALYHRQDPPNDMRGLRSSFRRLAILIIVGTILVCLHFADLSPLPEWTLFSRERALRLRPLQDIEPGTPPCRALAGAEDVVVVMRTGATEIRDKLPVHLNTTMRCYLDTLIFSDYAELFEGHEVHDALSVIEDHVKETNPDFAHYQRLRFLGREGLNQDELHSETYESGAVGKNDNPGWRLDKWKFLPMIVRTLELRPHSKFYIFVEPDTYILWSNMLQWLQTLDPSKPSYYGSEVQIGEDVFAHGGSAFVMTHAAMQKAADIYTSDPEEWHVRTAQHWAGDCILGTALNHAGVPLTWSWPMFQGGNPADMNWEESKETRRLWCGPVLSYHHVEPHEVEAMWAFEQQHILEALAEKPPTFFHASKTVLHHRDIFKNFVMPRILQERPDWTNLSPDLIEYSARTINTVEVQMDKCKAACEAKRTCLQYAVSPIGCSTSDQFKMGRASKGIRSDWNMKHVERWMSQMDSCGRRETGWIAT